MRIIVLFLLIFGCTGTSFAQFEGVLRYKVEVSSKTIDSLLKDLNETQIREIAAYFDSVTVFIRGKDFAVWKNNKTAEKDVLIHQKKKFYTMNGMQLSRKKERSLFSTDLTNPMYNKDNFEEYHPDSITVSMIDYFNKKCKLYVLKDKLITETFIIADQEDIRTDLEINYILHPYTGINLKSSHYIPFRNKILYAYRMDVAGIWYDFSLIDMKAEKLPEDVFEIPKANKKGIIKNSRRMISKYQR